jgi:hypothetical protein
MLILVYTASERTRMVSLRFYPTRILPAQGPSIVTIPFRHTQSNKLLQWTLQDTEALPPLSHPTQSLIQLEKTAAQSTQDRAASTSLQGLLQAQSRPHSRHATATSSIQHDKSSHERLWRFLTPHHHPQPSESQPIQSLIWPETKGIFADVRATLSTLASSEP